MGKGKTLGASEALLRMDPDRVEQLVRRGLQDESKSVAVQLELIALAERAALELSKAANEPWKLLFELARHLKAAPGADDLDVMHCKAAFNAFWVQFNKCRQPGRHERFLSDGCEYAWEGFAHYWEKVHTPKGSGPVELAFEKARRAPIRPSPAISDNFTLLASLAYHLQILRGNRNIMLPVAVVGSLFGKDKHWGSRMVNLLVTHGLIKVVKPKSSFQKRRAKEFRFLFDTGRYRPPA